MCYSASVLGRVSRDGDFLFPPLPASRSPFSFISFSSCPQRRSARSRIFAAFDSAYLRDTFCPLIALVGRISRQ
jgi:hypothetical protein